MACSMGMLTREVQVIVNHSACQFQFVIQRDASPAVEKCTGGFQPLRRAFAALGVEIEQVDLLLTLTPGLSAQWFEGCAE
jgi:hypothetical protein